MCGGLRYPHRLDCETLWALVEVARQAPNPTPEVIEAARAVLDVNGNRKLIRYRPRSGQYSVAVESGPAACDAGWAEVPGPLLARRRWSIATVLSQGDHSCTPMRAMVWPDDRPAQNNAKRAFWRRHALKPVQGGREVGTESWSGHVDPRIGVVSQQIGNT